MAKKHSKKTIVEIAKTEVTVIDDAGHLVNIEKPAEFNAAVLAFLDRHRSV